jgi:hypothetical protein
MEGHYGIGGCMLMNCVGRPASHSLDSQAATPRIAAEASSLEPAEPPDQRVGTRP